MLLHLSAGSIKKITNLEAKQSDTTLYADDAAYGSSYCNNDFEDNAPGRFSFLIFHADKVLKSDTLKKE